MKKFIAKLLVHGKMRVWSIPYFIFRIFRINNNKIVISSYSGKSFGDNGKYVALEMLNRKKDIDIVWLTKDISDTDFPTDIRLVKHGTVQAIYELCTARIWLDNCRKEWWVRKRKGQYYINYCHGGIPLKKVEKDAGKSLGWRYVKQAKMDSKMTDLMVSNSKFRTNLFKNSFWYDGDILECGSPKIEQIMIKNDNLKFRVCQRLSIDLESNIAMFAPTFRNSESFHNYGFDYERIQKALTRKFGGRWIIIKRYHPNVKASDDDEALYDATKYPDMQDLLRICDVLITDYSGTMFEMLYDMKKIVFLYANDLETYDRGFYFRLSELPFDIASDMCELERNINRFDYKCYQSRLTDFKKEVGLVEKFGASKTIVDIIMKVIQNNENK